jgi:sulfatase maturation enzyme AslB (radical SAM superfamily)
VEIAYSIPFLTEETFLLVTGDITHHHEWSEFQAALEFFRSLRLCFRDALKNSVLRPDHIICIPGNHDLELCPYDPSQPASIAQESHPKYRAFKIFLEELTEYAHFARGFTLNRPYVTVRITFPFCAQIIDLNSCINIHWYGASDGVSPASAPPIDTHPVLTRSDLRALTGLLDDQPHTLRIALMHHHLEDLPAPDPSVPDQVDRDQLMAWLVRHRFRLLLSGHTHAPSGKTTTLLGAQPSLFTLATGHSFLHGYTLPEGNHYQVLRLEFGQPEQSKAVRRTYAWITDGLFDRENGWSAPQEHACETLAMQHGVSFGEFKQSIHDAQVGTERFLGTSPHAGWAVVAHCESRKFESFGVLSPGETINAALLRMLDQVKGHLVRIDRGEPTEWQKFENKGVVFLVDSPHYNPYVASLLDRYHVYLAGGLVRFVDERAQEAVQQHLEIGADRRFRSNKKPDQELFDRFTDYLLLMRLPGIGPSHGLCNVEVPDLDVETAIWIVAGIHSKATYAGAMLFQRENIERFLQSLAGQCDGRIPMYFEAVYEIPEEPIRIEGVRHMQFLDSPVHFRELCLKTSIGMADGLAASMGVRFRQKNRWADVPLDTVHIDPVAACNYSCQGCIEGELRGKRVFLSLDRCLSICADLKAAGCRRVGFYGGEPTLHPEFATLLRVVAAMGYDVLVVTNGSRLAEDVIQAALIETRRRVHLRVSLDGCSAQAHARSHGLDHENGLWDATVGGIKKLLRSGVTATISILLHPHVISGLADACKEWRAGRATALVLRPVTRECGREPYLEYSTEDIEIMRQVLKEFSGFALTPRWFEEWLASTTPSRRSVFIPPKEYGVCYSAYYRMVISSCGEGRSEERVVCGVRMRPTEDAWISFCSYRRLDPDYGCPYPSDLSSWLQTERHSVITGMHPDRACQDVICCRDGFNRIVDELVSAGENPQAEAS